MKMNNPDQPIIIYGEKLPEEMNNQLVKVTDYLIRQGIRGPQYGFDDTLHSGAATGSQQELWKRYARSDSNSITLRSKAFFMALEQLIKKTEQDDLGVIAIVNPEIVSAYPKPRECNGISQGALTIIVSAEGYALKN